MGARPDVKGSGGGATHGIEWHAGDLGVLVAQPADPEAVARHAGRLAAWYNDDHNRAMLSNTVTMSELDVCEQVAAMRRAGDHVFLLFREGDLTGDADLRHVGTEEAEFAIMIGARDRQGVGLGTHFAIMVHAYAFGVLGLGTVYLSIVAANVAARRCYEKVGYVGDASCAASRYADDPDDVTMSLSREAFLARNRRCLDRIAIRPTDPAH